MRFAVAVPWPVWLFFAPILILAGVVYVGVLAVAWGVGAVLYAVAVARERRAGRS